MADLITKAQYKAYAGISSPNKDAQIDALIPRVSTFVKTYCRRSFIDHYSDPKSEQFSGPIDLISLRDYPVVEIVDVEYSSDYGQTYTSLVEYVDYVVEKDLGVIKPVSGSFSAGLNAYRVTYTCGYLDVPPDIEMAVLDLVTYYLKNDSAIHSNKAPGTNTVQVEFITKNTLPANIGRVLDLYVADYV